MAARRGEDHGRLPSHGASEGVVRGGVTCVQGEDDVDVAAGVGGLDRAHRELEAGETELPSLVAEAPRVSNKVLDQPWTRAR